MNVKYILIFLLLITSSGFVFSEEEEILLDINYNDVHKYKYAQQKYENKRTTIDEEDITPSFSNLKKMFEEDMYDKKTINSKREKKFGKNTVGTKTNTTIAPESINQKSTIYANRDLTKKLSVGTSYENSSSSNAINTSGGIFSAGPEYKLNSKTSIKNVYSRNTNNNSNKGEVLIDYRPFKDDRMDLNVGASQTNYDNGNQSSSQVKFGTNIKF